MNNKISFSYKNSGVDVEKGNEIVKEIIPFAKQTNRIGVMNELGGFGALFDLKKCNYEDPILVSATDGVGTKLKIAKKANIHNYIGIDLVAMCVNDVIVQGAEPLFFLDYFSSSNISKSVLKEVIKGIVEGCKIANCALIGGETAEMPGVYKKDEYDLAGFVVGVVERTKILPQKNIKAGDVILALKSSGVHSNGFSLIRKIIEKKHIDLSQKLSNNLSLLDNLLIPTKIYVKQCLGVHKSGFIKAFAHITGGGLFDNISRVIEKKFSIDLDYNSWEMPEIFKFFQEEGCVTFEEMLRTFNCGIGMVMICDEKDISRIEKTIPSEEIFQIGKIISK